MKASFSHRLAAVQNDRNSVVCIGLDPDPERMPVPCRDADDPVGSTFEFCRRIIAATADVACSYKFNFAFFESLGSDGWDVMRALLPCIPDGTLTIADAKRGDIGNSASFYARSIFEDLGFDAVTVHPYMGFDSVLPFLEYDGICTFVLARTSNPGGSDFQTLDAEGDPLYVRVARAAARWGKGASGETGLVVGATDIQSMMRLRKECPEVPFLIPGVGAQGGAPDQVREASASGPILVNSSRSILYASGGDDFESAATAAAERLRRSLHS